MNNPFFTDNFVLEDLTYIPIGNFVPMFNRPYMVNLDYGAVDAINSRLDDTKSYKITPNIINGLTDRIMQHSAVGYETQINNNWITTKKFIFMLKVSCTDQMGITNFTYIQGYTDYDGISMSGNIDMSLTHTINNVIETNLIQYNTPFGVVRREKLYKIYNVFTNDTSEMLFTQRPNDVFNNVDTINMFNLMGGGNLDVTNNLYTINPFDKRTVGSTVENNISTEYLSKILNAGMILNKEKAIHVNSFAIENVDSAGSRLVEPGFSDNRFFKYISRLAGSMSTLNKFQFQTLMQLDPSINDRFKLLNITKNYIDPNILKTPEVGEFWHGQDMITLKAYSVIESAVAMAVKYGFNKLYFIASNMSNPMSQAEIFITNFNSFINLEEQEFTTLLEIFKSNFINEVFLNESNNGQIPLHVEMYVDLLGTSKINITFAGYPGTWYTIPTFANSCFSPVVTVNKQAFDDLSQQLVNIVDTISSAGNNNVNNYY
ncbi:MAG: hypothetical protein ACD_33C00002G0042 [uncultured bacterium]|nr:MAG: hypothetical protein ACD_33C00002G0042 [uncultured bacterium]